MDKVKLASLQVWSGKTSNLTFNWLWTIMDKFEKILNNFKTQNKSFELYILKIWLCFWQNQIKLDNFDKFEVLVLFWNGKKS